MDRKQKSFEFKIVEKTVFLKTELDDDFIEATGREIILILVIMEMHIKE